MKQAVARQQAPAKRQPVAIAAAAPQKPASAPAAAPKKAAQPKPPAAPQAPRAAPRQEAGAATTAAATPQPEARRARELSSDLRRYESSRMAQEADAETRVHANNTGRDGTRHVVLRVATASGTGVELVSATRPANSESIVVRRTQLPAAAATSSTGRTANTTSATTTTTAATTTSTTATSSFATIDAAVAAATAVSALPPLQSTDFPDLAIAHSEASERKNSTMDVDTESTSSAERTSNGGGAGGGGETDANDDGGDNESDGDDGDEGGGADDDEIAAPRTRKRPRYRAESQFTQRMLKGHRTLFTTVSSFDALRADIEISSRNGVSAHGATQNALRATGVATSAAAAAAAKTDGAAGVASNFAAAAATATAASASVEELPSSSDYNQFFNAIMTRTPYWVQRANVAEKLRDADIPSLPAFDPAYCRRFRREPHSGRRFCARAQSGLCVGQLYLEHPRGPFAYMEFLTPEQDDAFVRLGVLPETTACCEMCIRYIVSHMWKQTHLYNHVASVTLNPHTHVCDVPGGYRKQACIQQVPGHSDGIFGTFRHFVVSEYVPCVEQVRQRDGTTTEVRGHDEISEVFF